MMWMFKLNKFLLKQPMQRRRGSSDWVDSALMFNHTEHIYMQYASFDHIPDIVLMVNTRSLVNDIFPIYTGSQHHAGFFDLIVSHCNLTGCPICFPTLPPVIKEEIDHTIYLRPCYTLH